MTLWKEWGIYNLETSFTGEALYCGIFYRFLRQITMWLLYLFKLHRDIACRNMLVGATNNVKARFITIRHLSDELTGWQVSDFGLSRESNAYEAKSKEIPYKWTAPEVIKHQVSDKQSDVWSFGVCAWWVDHFVKVTSWLVWQDNREIFSLGKGKNL